MRLELKNITKQYDRIVLNDISYSFSSGKIYVVKGVSGCGKSTLLNIIGGLEKQFEGQILVHENQNELVSGFMYQYSLLLSNITVMDNLLLIVNDKEYICEIAGKLEIQELLGKLPTELSGGERQRVAFIRLMLRNPDIILLDEPTASLDDKNSRLMVDFINSMDCKNKIVIIATHEHYFDEIADEIINIKYGIISGVHCINNDKNQSKISLDKHKETGRKTKINFYKFNLKRSPGLISLKNTFVFILMFLLIMGVSTVQNCFEKIYINNLKDNMPMDAFNISDAELKRYSQRDKLKIYYNYCYLENEVNATYLSDKSDSVLAMDNMIMCGDFPEKENEILISHEYYDRFLSNYHEDDVVGKNIQYAKKDWIISGILYPLSANTYDSRNDKFEYYYNSDAYYRSCNQETNIYIPYEKLMEFGNIQNLQVVRVSYPDLYDDYKEVKNLRQILIADFINVFDEQLVETQGTINMVSRMLLIMFVVCFGICCMFIYSQVNIDMFYRKKEIGFLKIFGVENKTEKKLLITGYKMKIYAALIYAMVIYSVLCIVISINQKMIIMCNIAYTLGTIVLAVVFYFLAVGISIRRNLKKSVMELIS